MVQMNEISELLQKGKAKDVVALVQQAIEEGIPAETILKEGLLAGMAIIGQKFRDEVIFVPEVLVAARAMSKGSEVLRPLLSDHASTITGKVCIGTVKGDLHDIGKNLVKMMMEGKGLEVIDLGTDVPAEKFVQTAMDEGCQVICCSCLLTNTMPEMELIIKTAIEAGIRDKVKIMVGGAPITREFAESIGADAYTDDAATAADVAADFCK